MNSAAAQPITVTVAPDLEVSGLFERPPHARALFVMGHGAGAGMRQAFLSDLSGALAVRGIACLRYQFPFIERQQRRPDSPALCDATIRAAIAWAGKMDPALPLIAGGKSFGGRMTSEAQAKDPLPGVCGLAFLGFPLHPANKPSLKRAEHLTNIRIPMLFLQGTRDALADGSLILKATERLGDDAALSPIDGADHGFHVLVRSGRTVADVLREVADVLGRWIDAVLS